MDDYQRLSLATRAWLVEDLTPNSRWGLHAVARYASLNHPQTNSFEPTDPIPVGLDRLPPFKIRLSLFQKRRHTFLFVLGRETDGEKVDLSTQALIEI